MAKTAATAATVSTSSIISMVAAKHDALPKKVTKEVLSSFLQLIEDELSDNSKVRIDGIGIVQVKDRAARKGRNPQTGEEIKIPASKKVAFRAAKSLKEQIGVKKKVAPKKAAAPAVKKKK